MVTVNHSEAVMVVLGKPSAYRSKQTLSPLYDMKIRLSADLIGYIGPADIHCQKSTTNNRLRKYVMKNVLKGPNVQHLEERRKDE